MFRIKKIEFKSYIFRIRLNQVRKFWPILSCLVTLNKTSQKHTHTRTPQVDFNVRVECSNRRILKKRLLEGNAEWRVQIRLQMKWRVPPKHRLSPVLLLDWVNTIYELVFGPSNTEAGDVNTDPFLYTWKNLHRWYVVDRDNCVH